MSFPKCGVCKRAPRVDDPGCVMRLHADDVRGDRDSQGAEIKPGAYQSCGECRALYAPRVAERLRKTPATDDAGQPVLNADGSPVMVLAPGRPITDQYLL